MKFFTFIKKTTCFLHIPKTGGTYIYQYETDKKPVISPIKYWGHSYIVTDSNDKNIIYENISNPLQIKYANVLKINEFQINNSFIVTTVRNIFDWLVSYYFHCGGLTPEYRDDNHYDYENAKRGFEYLVKSIANRDNIWPNKKFIFAQNFSSGGNLIADWISRTNTLDSDLYSLSTERNLNYQEKQQQRIGRTGQEKNYKSFYSDSLRTLVYNTWRREIDLYGFDFDNVDKKSIIDRLVTKKNKNAIKYCYKEDKLCILKK